jgi:hypothetical protein
MFSVGASMEESSRAFITKELSLFWRLAIPSPMCANPFAWLKTHEDQFLNVGFFVKQVLWILRSEIEIEIVLSLVGVLIALRCCRLQVQNLNQIITIINSWRDDSHLNCTLYVDLKDYLKAEISVANELIKEVEFFKELQVDED